MPAQFASADEPGLKGREWLAMQWEAARLRAGSKASLLVVDELQKIDGWAETVKRLWDEDTQTRRKVKVILLGSAPLLHDHDRWSAYVRDALIETSISRDVLLLTRVDKPALLRRFFEIGCQYSGQILSYTKIVGQLHDAGNTTTLAHYLDLLQGSGLLGGLQKFAGETMRQRASSPKFQVFNTALISAQAGYTLDEAKEQPAWWGRLVESAVGAHLLNAAASGSCELFYWREGAYEVDFVVRYKRRLIAIEVKSGRTRDASSGIERFARAFRVHRTLLVGADGIPVGEFLSRPVEHWIG